MRFRWLIVGIDLVQIDRGLLFAEHQDFELATGEAFYPVILALRAWGETWCKSPEEGRAMNYTHRPCGVPLERADLVAEPSPAYHAEREARWEAFKAR